MSHAIFRVQGIKTTSDLRGIGKHNADRISLTNDDIDSTRSVENIQLIAPPEAKTYLKKFFQIVEPMKLEHDEKMSTERKDRVKSFESKINSAKSDVACEFLFTSDENFFKGKSKEEIKSWANESLNFVKKEIGIDEENILHAVVHMDEKTPHLHVVAIPLVKKYDGRAKRDIWQLNRKHFIETKLDMSKLQDQYHERMQIKGYDLDRGEKGSKAEHLNAEEYKAKKLEEKVKELRGTYEKLQSKVAGIERTVEVVGGIDNIKLEKVGLFGSKTVKIASEDLESIKALAKASEVLKTQNKHFKMDNDALNFGNIKLNDQNKDLKKEIQALKKENSELKKEISRLKDGLEYVQKIIKYVKENLIHPSVRLAIENVNLILAYSKMRAMVEVKGDKDIESYPERLPEAEREAAKKYVERYKEEQSQSREKSNDKEMER